MLATIIGERASSTCGNILSLMISTAVALSDTFLVCLHGAAGGVFCDGFFELDDLVLLRAASADASMGVSKQFRVLSFLGGRGATFGAMSLLCRRRMFDVGREVFFDGNWWGR